MVLNTTGSEQKISRSTNARTVIAWIAAAQAVLLVVTLGYLWVRVFYLGDVDAVTTLSYHGADRPPVPEVPWQLGIHTFGDFLLPFEQARVPNPWIDYTMWPNPYPSGLVTLFKGFALLPYAFSLGVFLVLSALSMAIPIVIAARRLTLPVALIAACLFVFLSFPFGMVMDRANAQGLIVLPLYLFSISWREGHWRKADFALAFAVTLKLYPALLVIGLLAERRFRDAAYALGGAAAATVFLFALYPGGLIASVRGFLSGVARFSAPTVGGFTVGNYSVVGMVANFSAALFGSGAPPLAWLVASPWVLCFLYLAAVCVVVSARRLPFVVRMACAMSLLTLAVPLSYGYSLAFVVIVVAELLRGATLEGPDAELSRPLGIALAVAVTATLVPWPFPLPVTHSSIGTILVPAGWIGLTLTAIYERYGTMLRTRAASFA